MKNLFLLIFLTSFTALFGQTLKFDVLAKYSISLNNSTFEISAYAISSNNNYIMRVLNQPGGQKKIAQVYDLKSLKKHNYNITELKSGTGEMSYKFTYSNTSSIVPTPVENAYYDFQRVSVENDIETVKMFVYKTESKTKPINILELKILKSEVNFFPLFRFMCLHLSEFNTGLNYVNAGLVTYCAYENGNAKYTLTGFEEASLELILPN